MHSKIEFKFSKFKFINLKSEFVFLLVLEDTGQPVEMVEVGVDKSKKGAEVMVPYQRSLIPQLTH